MTYWTGNGWQVRHCDNCDPDLGLPSLEPDSVDSIITDPPAGIGFMGKAWDTYHRDEFVDDIAVRLGWARHALKPGGQALVWALPRTVGWTHRAIEDAGLDVRDVVTHHFGNGMAKGKRHLKPATEFWILASKPHVGPLQANIERWGTGGLRIDECRIAGEAPTVQRRLTASRTGTLPAADSVASSGPRRSFDTFTASRPGEALGRWPANLVLSHDDNCRLIGSKRIKGDRRAAQHVPGARPGGFLDIGAGAGSSRPNGTLHGDEVRPVYECVDGCPVAELDRQGGWRKSGYRAPGGKRPDRSGFNGPMPEVTTSLTYADEGYVSRFFYAAKPSRREKEAGCEGLDLGDAARFNYHPTVKAIELCRYLIRLVTPAGGLVLDPWCGSGAIGIAAGLEGLSYLGMDQDHGYCRIAVARLRHWLDDEKEQAA